MHHAFGKRIAAGILAIGSVLAAGAPAGTRAAPAAEDERPLPPIERLEQELLGMQRNISSATLRVGRPMQGLAGDPATPGGRPPTPAERCCSGNLEQIRGHGAEMVRTLENLFLYYGDRRDSEGVAGIEQIRLQLQVVAKGLGVFQSEGATPRAREALAGLIRPFNRLREAIEHLEACCPVDPQLWSEPGGTPRR